ncbi:MAG: glycosyltransferase [Bacteroidales bacterium]|nr:glycosyltransferase [Bacteroidales bacterium]
MKKIRIGVWLYDNYSMEETGGGYNYYSKLINKINEHKFKDAEIIFLSNKNHPENRKFHGVHEIQWKAYKHNKITKLINVLAGILHIKSRQKVILNRIKKNEQLLKNELNTVADVIYYILPGCIFPNFPYIYTLWDIGHLSSYAFPELCMNRNFEERNSHHDIYPHKALMIFAESNEGKNDIAKYLRINDDRIKVVPIFPSDVVNDIITPAQPKEIDKELFFIHYSAQYWAHKNHFNLLVAFKQILVAYPDIKLVLTGSDKGNKDYVKEIILELGLVKQVIDLGFVSTEELKWLYLKSQGLVMPSFLGPTNMPLLEAAELGCPVSCSNMSGNIEQLGEYGYYFDPKDPADISNKVCTMIRDKQNNIKKKYQGKFNIEFTLKAIDEAFTELRNIRFCWGVKDEIY